MNFVVVYCPFHSLAASLRRFKPVCGLQAKRSSGKKEEREPLPRSYTVLCRFIYPWDLSVRLKKYTVFIRVFSVFPRFSPIFPLNQRYFEGLFPFPETRAR
jgi:hypothetical protein